MFVACAQVAARVPCNSGVVSQGPEPIGPAGPGPELLLPTCCPHWLALALKPTHMQHPQHMQNPLCHKGTQLAVGGPVATSFWLPLGLLRTLLESWEADGATKAFTGAVFKTLRVCSTFQPRFTDRQRKAAASNTRMPALQARTEWAVRMVVRLREWELVPYGGGRNMKGRRELRTDVVASCVGGLRAAVQGRCSCRAFGPPPDLQLPSICSSVSSLSPYAHSCEPAFDPQFRGFPTLNPSPA